MMLKAGHSSMTSETPVKSRSIRFTDPFAAKPRVPMANRSTTTHLVPQVHGVRRSNTVAVGSGRYPRHTHDGNVNFEQRPVVGKASPSIQLEKVSPPRSPKDTPHSRGGRLPIRAKSADSSSRVKNTVTVTRGPSRGKPHGPNTTAVSIDSQSRSSMIPVRRGMAIMGWAESQATFRALTGNQHRRSASRGPLPSAWTSGAPLQKPSLHWHSTAPILPSEPIIAAERRRTNSEPEVDGPPSYPQLTSEERTILMRKLRVLLKYVGIDDEVMDICDRAPVHEIPTGTRGVFGRSVRDSSPYASCQVVLGEHSHTLPICVFASVEEICQRGVAAPGLFRVAPSLNERKVEKLTRAFDQRPSYGAGVSLSKEEIPNICALLKLYLRGLPEAVLSHSFWPIIQRLTTVHNDNTKRPSARIAAVQAILHLQHPTSFSLLVYLLAFLHQLVIHGSQNGLTIPTLAGIFGPALFSPRKGNAVRSGCVMSPPPGNQVLVKTFQSARDVAEGTRVMTWVLEHWDGIATGLLSLDIVHGSERDIPAWEANLLKGPLVMFRGDSDGQYSEGLSNDEIAHSVLELPFPEAIIVDRVPVHEVRNSIVETTEVPPLHSTRASSPATFWSQETGPNPAVVSRTVSLETARTTLEPAYIQELRHRMNTQEFELAILRQELVLIRSRFVFPLPPDNIPRETKGTTLVAKLDVLTTDVDEDAMPTPRPPSGTQCPEFLTMNELVDSLDSKPVTPLFHKTLAGNILDSKSGESSAGETMRIDKAPQSGESSSSREPSDSGLDTPPNEPALGTHCIVNPESISEGEIEKANEGKFQELLTARDALKSALAAMDPVKAQLKAVEEELKHRGENIM